MIYNTKTEIENAFIVGVTFSNKEDVELQLQELKSLANTANLKVVGQSFQYIRQITPATLLGTGKIDEIKQEIKNLNIDVVVIDHELTGSQARNLSEILDVKVIDRIILILDIFASRANSNEGKLQVQLAQMKYNLPRMAAIKGAGDKFGAGGVGMRGPGETKLEVNRRASLLIIESLEKEIEKIHKVRNTQKKSRRENNVFKVAIVGYTNAGKSTLLNLITKASIYADDKLFATLDTTSRTVWLGVGKKIILTDTVGFISKLPHELIDAFSSTLEEATDADLILHVIDISNPNYLNQIEVVLKVLKDLFINAPIINVYNKCDKIEGRVHENGIYISAKQNIGIEDLKAKISEYVKSDF